ncbi:MAG TPA: trypsin-like peptidase domain-containing protein [Micromonosporaceae bacterium]|jgi:putative serine protease PepD
MNEHDTAQQRYAESTDSTTETQPMAPAERPAPAANDEPATVQQPAVPTDSAAASAPYASSPTPPPPAAPPPGASSWPMGGYGVPPLPPAHGGGVPPLPPPPGGPQPADVPGQPPVWAQPAPARSNRFGKVVATGAAALALAVGSGLLGGYVATQQDDHSTVAASSNNGSSAAAPVIDRSSLASIAAAVSPSVVSINTGSGEGSGVILTADGYILTNNHVVASAQGDTMRVIFSDGKTATARLVGTDPKTDLGVIKAEGVSGLKPGKFGDSDSVQIGDTVLAVGNPLGLQGSVTAGIISAKDRTIQAGNQGSAPQSNVSSLSGMLQTDAPINPGNSGGALVNTSAQVIGINSAIATNGSDGNIGVGFAIPSNKAKQVADALMKGQKISHPFLGVSVGNADNGGATVARVQSGSPADKAGLQQGDVITKFGDKVINTSDDLVSAVQSGKVGDQVTVTYTRNGDQKTATVTLGEAS